MIHCIFENGNKGLLRHVVVNVLIIKDNKILLEKRTKTLLEGGKWGLPGGFMDRDETIKDTAVRETMEETGWKIKDLQLFQIIDSPKRSGEDRQNVCFVYTAKAVSKVGKSDWESDSQQWFSFNDLPSNSLIAFDFNKVINLYKKYQQEQFKLPIIGYIAN